MTSEMEEQPAVPFVPVLSELMSLRRGLDALEHVVIMMVRAQGATWEQIGDELGISRQAARQRFGKLQQRQR